MEGRDGRRGWKEGMEGRKERPNKKCQCNKNEFSKKYQYSKNQLHKKDHYSKNEISNA